VIVNLDKFILRQQPIWDEYETMIESLENDATRRLDLQGIQRLRYLHERVAGDLVRIRTFASEPETLGYLESLLARGFGFIHENRGARFKLRSCLRIFSLFPATVRRHSRPLLLVVLAFLFGGVTGGFLVTAAPDAKEVLLPFPHLLGDPSDRVAMEESEDGGRVGEVHATFAAQLMVHNIRVSIFALVLGVFMGVFTVIVVFYNGVILGAVVTDYLLSGEGVFLAGWLLPHGSVEIPAILIAAQAGLLIGRAVMIRSGRLSLTARLRGESHDVMILILGVSLLLVWAGIIESFFSQYHAPILPYSVKISFGVLQLVSFCVYMWKVKPSHREEDT
jgi:uncharacterized membrane protein SpoIIM required for sporulation